MVDVFIGTRPEVVKLCPVVLALRDCGIEVRVITTGQHKNLQEHFDAFDIKPDVEIECNHDLSLTEKVSDMIRLISDCFTEETKSVIVQGDTASVFAGAMAAFLQKIPVIHVEAGLRTYNLKSPFPEEGFRQMVARVAALNFSPTDEATAWLGHDGILTDTVHQVGNTVIDGLRLVKEQAANHTTGLDEYILVTCHRRENLGEPAQRLADFLKTLDLEVIVIMHPNPEAAAPFGCKEFTSFKPLPYKQMIGVLSKATLVITDSGGLVEEATALGVPVAIYRDTTERQEAVNAGVARMAFDEDTLSKAVDDVLDGTWNPEVSDVFGDGHAADRIAKIMIEKGLT
jgi:UDP-N-acetylglucosamine 2-epimerase (non-hydrolysing)